MKKVQSHKSVDLESSTSTTTSSLKSTNSPASRWMNKLAKGKPAKLRGQGSSGNPPPPTPSWTKKSPVPPTSRPQQQQQQQQKKQQPQQTSSDSSMEVSLNLLPTFSSPVKKNPKSPSFRSNKRPTTPSACPAARKNGVYRGGGSGGNSSSSSSSSSSTKKLSKKAPPSIPRMPPPPLPKFDVKKLANKIQASTQHPKSLGKLGDSTSAAPKLAPRPTGQSAATNGIGATGIRAPPPQKIELWHCRVCYYRNHKKMTRCGVCGSSKDPPPKSAKPPAPKNASGGEKKSKAQKNAETRKKLLKEIVDTEEAYVCSLSVLFLEFMLPLANGSAEPPPELDKLSKRARVRVFFSHTRRILDVNRKFLHELNTAKEHAVYGHYAESHERVSALFREAFEKKEAKEWLADLPKQSKRWAQHVPQGSPFFLLIKPVQRVPRYRLLIQELVKLTPPIAPSYSVLEQALGVIKVIASHVNETIRQAENQEKLHTLQRQWDDPDKVDLLEGDAKNRHLVKEGALDRQTRRSKVKKGYFHLFNDMLLYSEKRVMGKVTGSVFKLNFRSFLTPACAVSDTALATTGGTTGGFTFAVETPVKSFVVEAENQKEKNDWMKSIQESIESTRKAMLAKEGGSLTASEATAAEHAIAPVWVKDTAGATCQLCSSKFGFINRRHHCRVCGRLVCSKCSPHRRMLPNISKSQKQRVCNECNTTVGLSSSHRSPGGRSSLLLKSGSTALRLDESAARSGGRTTEAAAASLIVTDPAGVKKEPSPPPPPARSNTASSVASVVSGSSQMPLVPRPPPPRGKDSGQGEEKKALPPPQPPTQKREQQPPPTHNPLENKNSSSSSSSNVGTSTALTELSSSTSPPPNPQHRTTASQVQHLHL
eukprot:jgi/Bigna1/125969/aug1.1_g677